MGHNVNNKFTIEYRSTIDGFYAIIFESYDWIETLKYFERCVGQDANNGSTFAKNQYRITTPDIR